MEEDEEPYEIPKPSKNFFSIFKRIEPIFSRYNDPSKNNEGGNEDTMGDPQQNQSESLFSG